MEYTNGTVVVIYSYVLCEYILETEDPTADRLMKDPKGGCIEGESEAMGARHTSIGLRNRFFFHDRGQRSVAAISFALQLSRRTATKCISRQVDGKIVFLFRTSTFTIKTHPLAAAATVPTYVIGIKRRDEDIGERETSETGDSHFSLSPAPSSLGT